MFHPINHHLGNYDLNFQQLGYPIHQPGFHPRYQPDSQRLSGLRLGGLNPLLPYHHWNRPVPYFPYPSSPTPPIRVSYNPAPKQEIPEPVEEKGMDVAGVKKTQHVIAQLREAADEMEKELTENSEVEIPDNFLEGFTWEVELHSGYSDYWDIRGIPATEEAKMLMGIWDLLLYSGSSKESQWERRMAEIADSKLKVGGGSLYWEYLSLAKAAKLIMKHRNLEFKNTEALLSPLDEQIKQLEEFKGIRDSIITLL